MPTRPATPADLYAIAEIYVGRLTRVGYKHDRFIDTLLLQRSLA